MFLKSETEKEQRKPLESSKLVFAGITAKCEHKSPKDMEMREMN